MKKPEEIKKGLDICSNSARCRGCPYLVYVEGSCGCHEMGCEDDLLPDALAYIQQLEARVPRWIPVEERMPEEKELVLVHYTDDWMPVAFLLNGNWYNSGGERSWLSVTHWMPLPEPPEEG